MKKRTKIAFLLLAFSWILTLNGCVNNEYDNFKVQFNKIYLEIAKTVDVTDTGKALEDIKSKDNLNRINELGVLLENIQDKVPKDKRDEYIVYTEWYEGLVFLRDISYSEWDNLSFEQRSSVWGEIAVLGVSKN